MLLFTHMKFNIRFLYLYLFSFVGLLIAIIGSIGIIDLSLKTYVFKVSRQSYYNYPMVEGETKISNEEMEKINKKQEDDDIKRQMSNSLAMIIVGTPVYLYHWKTIKKEK